MKAVERAHVFGVLADKGHALPVATPQPSAFGLSNAGRHFHDVSGARHEAHAERYPLFPARVMEVSERRQARIEPWLAKRSNMRSTPRTTTRT